MKKRLLLVLLFILILVMIISGCKKAGNDSSGDSSRGELSDNDSISDSSTTEDESHSSTTEDVSETLPEQSPAGTVVFSNQKNDTGGELAKEILLPLKNTEKQYRVFIREPGEYGYYEYQYLDDKIIIDLPEYKEGEINVHEKFYFNGSEWTFAVEKDYIESTNEGIRAVNVSTTAIPVTVGEITGKAAVAQFINWEKGSFVKSGIVRAFLPNESYTEEDLIVNGKSQDYADLTYEEYSFEGFENNLYFLFNGENELRYVYYNGVIYIITPSVETAQYYKALFTNLYWADRSHFDKLIEENFLTENIKKISLTIFDLQKYYNLSNIVCYDDRIVCFEDDSENAYYFNGTDWYKIINRINGNNSVTSSYEKAEKIDFKLNFLLEKYLENRVFLGSGKVLEIQRGGFSQIFCEYADYSFPDLGIQIRLYYNENEIFLADDENLQFIDIEYWDDEPDIYEREWIRVVYFESIDLFVGGDGLADPENPPGTVKFLETFKDTKGKLAENCFGWLPGGKGSNYFSISDIDDDIYAEFRSYNGRTFIPLSRSSEGSIYVNEYLFFDGFEWFSVIKREHLGGNGLYVTDSYTATELTESQLEEKVSCPPLIYLENRRFIRSGRVRAYLRYSFITMYDLLAEYGTARIKPYAEFTYEEYSVEGYDTNIYFFFNDDDELRYVYYGDGIYYIEIQTTTEDSRFYDFMRFNWIGGEAFDKTLEETLLDDKLFEVYLYYIENDDGRVYEPKYHYNFYQNKIEYFDRASDKNYYFNGKDWYLRKEDPENKWDYVFEKVKNPDIEIDYLLPVNFKNRVLKGTGYVGEVDVDSFNPIELWYADYEFPGLDKEVRFYLNNNTLHQESNDGKLTFVNWFYIEFNGKYLNLSTAYQDNGVSHEYIDYIKSRFEYYDMKIAGNYD